jgi:hypothetical protein
MEESLDFLCTQSGSPVALIRSSEMKKVPILVKEVLFILHRVSHLDGKGAAYCIHQADHI